MSGQSLLESLHNVNSRIRRLLATLHHDTMVTAAQGLSTLLADLTEIGPQLDGRSMRSNHETYVRELREYRRLLQELQREIPVLHSRFLAERARLERERNHLQATTCWTNAALTTTHFK
jgi:hypothetical protein